MNKQLYWFRIKACYLYNNILRTEIYKTQATSFEGAIMEFEMDTTLYEKNIVSITKTKKEPK